MIDAALDFLRDQLNATLTPAGDPAADTVAFVDGDKQQDAVVFKLGTVSVLLVNLEEEGTLRSADPYARITPDGVRHRACPEVRLNLYVLFVAHFPRYADSLRQLSEVVAHFQNHRVFTPANAPTLNAKIGQLVVELVTLPFSELNEIWGALRTSYRPSVLYRVRLVVFRDETLAPERLVQEVRVEVSL